MLIVAVTITAGCSSSSAEHCDSVGAARLCVVAKSGGYQIKGSIAPVCGPVAFHDDRLLAPLSDGTLLLPAVKRLHEKAPPGQKASVTAALPVPTFSSTRTGP